MNEKIDLQMQQAEMDELRHQEANRTALAAIGSRKLRAAQVSLSSFCQI